MVDSMAEKTGRNNDFDYCSTLASIVNGERPEAKTLLQSGSTGNNLKIIRSVVQKVDAKDTLEVGLACGVSALAFLATLAGGEKTDFSHTAIDPYQSSAWHSLGIKHVEEAGFSKNFTCIHEPSSIALASLVKANRKFDVIYVDGSHLFEDVFVDMYFCNMLTRVGGYVLMDDSTDPHVSKVIRFMRSNFCNILQESTFDDAVQLTLKRRLGRLLGYRQLTIFTKRTDSRRVWNAKFSSF